MSVDYLTSSKYLPYHQNLCHIILNMSHHNFSSKHEQKWWILKLLDQLCEGRKIETKIAIKSLK